jgi:hypothetical protein
MRSAILALLLVAAAARAADLAFFVAVDGDDAWSGTLSAANAQRTDGPWATLEGARDRVRQVLAAAGDAPSLPRIMVLLRGGTHVLSRPLLFAPEDSGGPGRPVVYAGFPGERAVVSGGRRIAGWRPAEGGLWVAEVPKGWTFTRLFVNGERRTRARRPDTDSWGAWLHVAAGGPPAADAPEGMGSRTFTFAPGAIRACDNLGDIEINCLPSYRYANFISTIAALDPASSQVTLTALAYYNFQPGDPFRVENAFDALDRPGEWCVNTVAGTVHYWPLAGEDMARAEVVAPVLHQLIRFQGDEERAAWVHDIELRDLTFTHCDRRRWHETPKQDEANLHLLESAVHLEAAERCAIEHCRFVDVAGFAARFNLACRNSRFVHNEVVGAGGGGIQLGGYGPGTRDVNQGHTVTNNHIHHSSNEFWHAGAIDVRQSGGNRIASNLIHHMPYTGICISGAHTAYFQQYRQRGEGFGRAKYNFRWAEIPADNPLTAASLKPFLHGRNNLVEDNVLYEMLGRLPADGGALYGFGQGLGNVFRNNAVSRAHCLGIYLDNEFDEVLVEGNLVVDSAAPFGGSGGSPILRDNALYAQGQTPAEARRVFAAALRLSEAATGPWWYRPAPLELTPERPPKSAARAFAADFAALTEGDLPGQGGWSEFGPGGAVAVAPGLETANVKPGLSAVAAGVDTWAVIWHGISLDPTQELLLQVDACLAGPVGQNCSFEIYLNRGQVHDNAAFGMALLGGQQGERLDAVGARQDVAGPRLLTTETLLPGHWYRLRLQVQGSGRARLTCRDLTAGETALRPLTFADGATETTLRQGEAWSPAWGELDALIVRLGGQAQVANVVLQNPPVAAPE